MRLMMESKRSRDVAYGFMGERCKPLLYLRHKKGTAVRKADLANAVSEALESRVDAQDGWLIPSHRQDVQEGQAGRRIRSATELPKEHV